MSILSIAAKLGLDIAGYEAGIQKVTSKNSQLNRSLEDVKSGVGALVDSLGSIGGVSSGVTGQLGEVISITNKIPDAFKNIGNGIKGFGTSITSALKAMFTSFSGFISSITAAVASTGIGAIIIAIATALAGLVSWLKNSTEGADFLKSALNNLKAVIEVTLTKLSTLGSAIVKIFKGDFKGAVNGIKEAFTGWGDALKENLNRSNEITKTQIEYEEWLIKHNLRLADMNKKASEYALIMKDESYSLAERQEALKKYQDIQKDIYNEKKKNLDYQIKIMELEQAQGGYSSREDLKKLNDLKAQRVDIQAEYNNKLKETLRLQNSLNNQEKELTIGAIIEMDKNAWDSIRKEIKEADKIEPTEVNPFEGLEDNADIAILKLEDVTNAWGAFKDGIRSVVNDLIPSLDSLRDTTIKAFGHIYQTLATGANSFKEYGKAVKAAIKQAISAIIGEAVMTMVAAQLKKVAWLNPAIALAIATAAGGLASTTLNAFASSVLKFSSGGVVPYSSYIGDNIPALVNSGEMVLNTTQQRNLFRMLNSASTNTGIISGEVRFEIEGDKLVGVLNNYNNINNRL